jgi:cell division protein FtsZ
MNGNRFCFADEPENKARVKVVGVGGAGCSAIDWMTQEGFCGVDLIAMNTDIRSLETSTTPHRVQLGRTLTQGSSAGFDPEVGRKAAEEEREPISQALDGANVVIMIAGMGRGTGQGASPVVAGMARERGALTLAIVTRPFVFEGKTQMEQAEIGIAALKEQVDAIIVVPSQQLMAGHEPKTTLVDAYHLVDDFLYKAAKGISNLVTGSDPWALQVPALRSALTQKGHVALGIGAARGEQRCVEATKEAMLLRLFEDASLKSAHNVLVNFCGGQDMTVAEIEEASQVVSGSVGENAEVRFGMAIGCPFSEEISVTLLATGLNGRTPNHSEVIKTSNGDPFPGTRHPILKPHKQSAIRRLPIVVGDDSLPLNNSEPAVPEFLRH